MKSLVESDVVLRADPLSPIENGSFVTRDTKHVLNAVKSRFFFCQNMKRSNNFDGNNLQGLQIFLILKLVRKVKTWENNY